MKKIFIIIIILLLPQILFAGRYASDFIIIGSGVRPLGMGGAFAAVADNGSAIYWNASGLAQIKEIEAEVMRAFLYGNLAAYDFFSFCIPLPANTTIGISFTQLSIDDIDLHEEKWLIGTNVDIRSSDVEQQLTGIPDGTFSSTDQLFEFAFAKKVSQILNLGWSLFDLPVDYYIGGTFKYIKRNLYKNMGTGMGFDLSFMIKTDFALLTDVDWLGAIKFAINLQDVAGTEITWDTKSKHSDEIITNPKLGLAIVQPLEFIKSEIILAYDWDNMYELTRNVGLEFTYNNQLSFRSGLYDKHFSAGMGIRYKRYNINYAFITNVDLGNSHRVGLTVNF
ncbi:MAG: PorV/PorQ family protein [Candidatus Cloacimonetes bacterium]|nr:PorV/PorQ family protein [Candidatus Cloacimonadota bacterium]